VQIAPMSRFGVVELSRGQLRRPLHELLCDDAGAPSAETEALAMIRGVEREVRGARGRLAVAFVGSDVMAWLDEAPFDWRAALSARIGPRWDVRAAKQPTPRGWRVEVE
jgi:Ribonuclease G/E